MVKITGGSKHAARLARIRGPAMIEGVTQALFGGAQDIQIEAQISITEGATSGAAHVPSAPGTPPNNDSGVLAGNIEAAITAPLKAETSSNAPYAAAQELGSASANLPERPYMRPAAQKMRPRVVARVAQAINKVSVGG